MSSMRVLLVALAVDSRVGGRSSSWIFSSSLMLRAKEIILWILLPKATVS